jgi:hypothetical protein
MMTKPTDDEQSMEAILRRIRYLHEEERLQEHPAPDRPIDQLKKPDPAGK